jgi:hypothetical protein
MGSKKTIISKAILWTCLLACAAVVTSCANRELPDNAEPTDIVEDAAAEATAIIQAQSEATALFAQVGKATPTENAVAPTQASAATLPASLQVTAGTSATGTPEVALQGTPRPAVEILHVTFGAEGAYIAVYFTAMPEIAATFWPGMLSVTDEASGTRYTEVPVVPVIGPLIARPRESGQPGYFMLVNAPVPLQSGALVTVIMGDFKKEHVVVE